MLGFFGWSLWEKQGVLLPCVSLFGEQWCFERRVQDIPPKCIEWHNEYDTSRQMDTHWSLLRKVGLELHLSIWFEDEYETSVCSALSYSIPKFKFSVSVSLSPEIPFVPDCKLNVTFNFLQQCIHQMFCLNHLTYKTGIYFWKFPVLLLLNLVWNRKNMNCTKIKAWGESWTHTEVFLFVFSFSPLLEYSISLFMKHSK